MRRLLAVLALVAGIALATVCSQAQNSSQRLELNRTGESIVLEPYAPNILRVTLSLQRESALAAPGYGLVAAPDAPAGAQANRASRRVQLAAHGRQRGPRTACRAAATADHGRHCQILQRLHSGRAHHLSHPRRHKAA
jgi:hypothetical protein